MIDEKSKSEQRLADLQQLKTRLYKNDEAFDLFADKCEEWRRQFPDTWQYCRLYHLFIASTIAEEDMESGKIFEDFEGNLVENYIRGLVAGK